MNFCLKISGLRNTVEFARRKPFEVYPTEDTSYDQDVFFIDAKQIGVNYYGENEYTVRKWNDDFTQKPTGIYSPDTAFNLRLSPFNSMLRHGWAINSGLTLYPHEKIKYGSSTGNSNLTTIYSENGEIQNSNLQAARYVPDIIEFDHEVDMEISQLLTGSKIINNKTIPNVYGLIEFINENNESERGFLLSVKPNGEGKWRLLKSNR